MVAKDGASFISLIGELQDKKRFQELNWEWHVSGLSRHCDEKSRRGAQRISTYL